MNQYRQGSGLGLVTVNAAWSQGISKHLTYLNLTYLNLTPSTYQRQRTTTTRRSGIWWR